MEKLIIKSNGQWKLQKNWTDEDHKNAVKWIESGLHEHFAKVPRAEGKTRSKMMNLMSEHTESRTHPETGEKEYKVYRAEPDGGHEHHNKRMTSWTTDIGMAHYWTHMNFDKESDKKQMQVSHAWVPEKHIHSYLTTDTVNRTEDGEHRDEQEVMVQPHKINIHHFERGDELQNNVKKLMGPK